MSDPFGLMSAVLASEAADEAAAAVAESDPPPDQQNVADSGSALMADTVLPTDAVTDAAVTDAGQPTAGLLGDEADPTATEDTGDWKTPPKPPQPTCTGWLENCMCPRCFNESRETDHGKPIPDTEGVTLMTPRGHRNLHRNNKRRKYGSQPPSPVL
jgi:hypothetical protein